MLRIVALLINVLLIAGAAAIFWGANKSTGDQKCTGSTPDQFKCYRAYYNDLVKTKGVGAAMADLRARYHDPFVSSQCHQLTHIIGRATADLYPSVSEAFRSGDGFCWSGFYHGVMEGVAQEIGRADLPQELDSICQDIPGGKKPSFDYYNCVHGLGHGIMSIVNNELFESLELCNNLTGAWEQSYCGGGVFMENIMADQVNHYSKYLKADDLLYPCNAVSEKYKATCYLMQPTRMIDVLGNDFSKVFELCSTVGEPYMNACYQGLGMGASAKAAGSIEQTKTYCLGGKGLRQQSNCVIGAVENIVSYFHSDREARMFCASLPHDLQSVCYTTTENYYRLF